MSKRNEGDFASPYNTSYAVTSGDSVKNLEGKLLTLIEAIGLKETQEQAVKSHASSHIWNWFSDSLWNQPIEDTEAHELFKKHRPVVGGKAR